MPRNRRQRSHHSDNPGCTGGYVASLDAAVTCKKCLRWMEKQGNQEALVCTFEVYEAADGRAATTPRIGKALRKGAQVPVGRYRAVLERLED